MANLTQNQTIHTHQKMDNAHSNLEKQLEKSPNTSMSKKTVKTTSKKKSLLTVALLSLLALEIPLFWPILAEFLTMMAAFTSITPLLSSVTDQKMESTSGSFVIHGDHLGVKKDTLK